MTQKKENPGFDLNLFIKMQKEILCISDPETSHMSVYFYSSLRS